MNVHNIFNRKKQNYFKMPINRSVYKCMWYSYTMGYCLSIRNKVLMYATMWMKSEYINYEKTNHMIPFILSIKKTGIYFVFLLGWEERWKCSGIHWWWLYNCKCTYVKDGFYGTWIIFQSCCFLKEEEVGNP